MSVEQVLLADGAKALKCGLPVSPQRLAGGGTKSPRRLPQTHGARQHLAQIYQGQGRAQEAEMRWRAVRAERPDLVRDDAHPPGDEGPARSNGP